MTVTVTNMTDDQNEDDDKESYSCMRTKANHNNHVKDGTDSEVNNNKPNFMSDTLQ